MRSSTIVVPQVEQGGRTMARALWCVKLKSVIVFSRGFRRQHYRTLSRQRPEQSRAAMKLIWGRGAEIANLGALQTARPTLKAEVPVKEALGSVR
jgi:hypothetical protein